MQRIYPICENRISAVRDWKVVLLPVSDLVAEAYRPDENGDPVTDLRRLMGTADPEMRAFIQEHLLRQVGETSGVSDPDLAIELTKGRFETSQDYANRMYGIYHKFRAEQEEFNKNSSNNE